MARESGKRSSFMPEAMTQHPLKHKTIGLLLCSGLLGAGCDPEPTHIAPNKAPLRAKANTAPLRAPAKEEALPEPRSHTVTDPAVAPSAPRPPCPSNTQPQSPGSVRSSLLQEISGVVASSTSPGLLWVHNDSGDAARVYALTDRGKLLGSLALPTPARDWEDIALEPRTNGRDLIYLADIGDNLGQRPAGLTIHRVEEPTRAELLAVQPQLLKPARIETMHLEYPDEPQDAEALLVDPLGGEILIITKPRLGLPQLYSAGTFQETATLRHVGEISHRSAGLALHLVTGADISRDGRWILVRTYRDVALFYRPPGTPLAEALRQPACRLPSPQEPQGEAIGFLTPNKPGGLMPPSFVTISEGEDVPLHRFDFLEPGR